MAEVGGSAVVSQIGRRRLGVVVLGKPIGLRASGARFLLPPQEGPQRRDRRGPPGQPPGEHSDGGAFERGLM
jgi:hypothetical protein